MTSDPTMHLLILNNAPYGDERGYNALGLALNLAKRPVTAIRIFLTGNGVLCAIKGQKTPAGFHNVETMIKTMVLRGKVAT